MYMPDESMFIQKYGEILGRGRTALICGTDEVAAKIYVEWFSKDKIFHEAYLMALVEECGLPVPKVYGIEQCGTRYVLRMSRAKGRELAEITKSGEITPEALTDLLVALQVQMHQISVNASHLPSTVSEFRRYISCNSWLTDAEKQKLLRLLESMPNGNSLCHGDFHAGNILVEHDVYTIIDWAEVSMGPAAADACRTYMDYRYLVLDTDDKKLSYEGAERYLERYTAATGVTREEILAWLPFHAATLYGQHVKDEGMNRDLHAIIRECVE